MIALYSTAADYSNAMEVADSAVACSRIISFITGDVETYQD